MQRIHGVPNKLGEFIKYLGDTKEEITETLMVLGCDGFQRNPLYCPVAIGIKRYVKTWPGFRVGPTGVFFSDPQILNFYFPELIKDWIKEYDHGLYPELIRP